MSKKILIKYILMYIPMVVGIVLFSSGVVNLFSSLLLFLGGYVAIKNTLDYRLVRKNVNGINIRNEEDSKMNKINNSEKVYVKSRNLENTPVFKRTRRYSRVRKKY